MCKAPVFIVPIFSYIAHYGVSEFKGVAVRLKKQVSAERFSTVLHSQQTEYLQTRVA